MSRSLDVMMEARTGLEVSTKRMFGGRGFFVPGGSMFAAIVSDDRIVIKLEHGSARDELIAAGGHPWTYEGRAKKATMHQWIVVPDSFYDDTDRLHSWLGRAYALVPSKTARLRTKVSRSSAVSARSKRAKEGSER